MAATAPIEAHNTDNPAPGNLAMLISHASELMATIASEHHESVAASGFSEGNVSQIPTNDDRTSTPPMRRDVPSSIDTNPSCKMALRC